MRLFYKHEKTNKEAILSKEAYKDFTKRFGLFIKKHPTLIAMTLSNIVTMRLIGNKTHGDLAEIAISEFINQYMYDFKSIHVGKDLYRAKSKEEDITVENEVTNEKFSISLKAYGDGPLQLSTDKNFQMYPLLETHSDLIDNLAEIKNLFAHAAFSCFSDINVLPLIYDEKKQRCNILVFDAELAKNSTVVIKKESEG
ncbi:MAG: hypothetical protein WCI06_08975, partial [Methylococcaceae bacterium]